MPGIPQDQIDVLLDGFRRLLQAYRPADPDDAANPADAFFLYRLLLGRNPNPTADLPWLLSDPRTFRALKQGVLDSDEFAASRTFTPPHRLWMADLDEFRFWFDTSDREMGVVMAMGRYEPECVRFVRRVLRPGMRCLDAGAQTGFYTCLMASLVGETGTVHAFEPMPESYQLLLKNVAENRFDARVRVYQLACSNTAAQLEASRVGRMYVAGTVDECPRVSMTAVRVDDIVRDDVDFVKIDVEGHEPAALEGMRQLIGRSHPIIVSECNDYWFQSCSGTSSREYIDLLRTYGYEAFELTDLTTALTPDSQVLRDRRIFDVVAIPQGAAEAHSWMAQQTVK
jgi:FkbM family methyltransferase